MALFGKSKSKKSEEEVENKSWLEKSYPDVFKKVSELVKSSSPTLKVSDMDANINRLVKESPKADATYEQMLASLFIVTHLEKEGNRYLKPTDFDAKKKAVFSFVISVAKSVDYKKTLLGSLVIRMCVDFIEVYKEIINEFDNRLFANKEDQKTLKILMGIVAEKQALLEVAQKFEMELQAKKGSY